MVENAKGEGWDKDEEEAVYQRRKIRQVEKGHSQKKAGEETSQNAEEDTGESHALIIKVTVTFEVTVTLVYSFTATMISDA